MRLKMKLLQAFSQRDGAHWGLLDWYENGEAELKAALADHIPFDTGWYSSKKEIANARIWSEDGIKIKVEVFVSDDFDTIGLGYASTGEWLVDAIHACISNAWEKAEKDQEANAEYVGFKVVKHSDERFGWVETYLFNIGWGENLVPPGDYYHWWGWQNDQNSDGEGIPDPRIPTSTVVAFEKWAQSWCHGEIKEKTLRIGEWEIIPFCPRPPEAREDPSDYVGMGWVGRDGRP